MAGPVLREVLKGLMQGVNSVRAGSSAFNPAVTTALSRAQFSFRVHLQGQRPSPGTAGMFGHAPQQQPTRGPAPSNTPNSGPK